MKILLYTLYFMLFACCFTSGLLYGHESIEIDSVRAGFNGLYRPGYWCPISIRIKTGKADFYGKVILKIDKNTYTQDVVIPVQAQREIIWNVLIYSLNPHSQIIFSPENGKEKLLPIILRPISTHEFLIALERRLFPAFQREFERYSDAARRTLYFTFSPEDLPTDWPPLEAVDLLVISKDSLQNPRLAYLKQWGKSSLGNLLVLKEGFSPDLEDLRPLRIKRSDSHLFKPEIYSLFERPRWTSPIKYNATRFLILYLLVTIGVLVFSFWVTHNKWPGSILWVVIIGGVGASFGLLFGFCPITYSLSAESIHIVTLNRPGHGFIQEDFTNLTSLSDKPLLIPFARGDNFLKPLFTGPESITQRPLHYSVNDRIVLQDLALGKRDSIVFKRENVQEFKGRFKVNYIPKQAELLSKYRIVNETNFNLEDCFLLYLKQCLWLGELPTAQTVEVCSDRTRFTTPLQLFNLKFDRTDKKSRYQKRILEMYLKKYGSDKQLVLFGWTEKPPKEYKIIPYEETYPTLWIMPIIPDGYN